MQKLLLTVFFSFSLLFISCKKTDPVNVETINIGGLFSITGNWSSLGVASREAMILAVSDINAYMEENGSRYRFATTVYDTKLDTSLAKQFIQTAYNNNIRYIIGPQSSAELGAIRNFANSNKMIVVSQGSTASSLAIAGDAIFRFCPGDAVEGNAMAKTIYASGRKALITMSRNDAGNEGLQNATGSVFTSLGGVVYATTPYSTTTTNYSTLLATVKTKIQEYTTTYGADKVGVYLASFDECVELFKQAKTDPVFSTVRWYGGDGVVLSEVILNDNLATAFAASTQFFAPTFGLPQQAHPDLASISASIKNKTGADPDAYALAVYDAMWVIARTAAEVAPISADFTKAKDLFKIEANKYFGITGPMLLNAAGDRSTGSFDYYGIVIDAGVYKWKFVGKSF
jgi:branched-chain amino acid transport system substrate-binding protein